MVVLRRHSDERSCGFRSVPIPDFDELPTKGNSVVSSVSRLTIRFKSKRPKAWCAGLKL